MDVSALKVVDLRRELRARGLPINGDKAELSARLKLAIQEAALEEELDLDAGILEPTEPAALVSSSTPEPASKKIVLNRTVSSLPAVANEPLDNPSTLANVEPETPETPSPNKQIKTLKLTVDSKTRLEMRAKRFGLAPTADAAKEARKARFGGSSSQSKTTTTASAASLEALQKRAERFGLSVSRHMVDIENKQKLERRKAKFGVVTS